MDEERPIKPVDPKDVERKRGKMWGTELTPEENRALDFELYGTCPNCGAEPLDRYGACIRCGNVQKVGDSDAH